ncbi:MAG: hypothetical protein D6731_24680 [Planctomycetota bacterium]|nr:MAG: hypothetical protein D6731_24680 [Planctomycetota bacterium]
MNAPLPPPPAPLEEGERLLAAGDAAAALVVWTEALARAEDPVLRSELARRLAGLHRRRARLRLLLPLVVLGLLLPLAAAGAAVLGQRAERRRASAARSALEDARAAVERERIEAALRKLAGVALRYPGTAAAEEAVKEAGALEGAARRAREAAGQARALLERGEAADAVRLLDELLERGGLPASPLRTDVEGLRARAAEAAELRRAAAALEERDFAQAAELFQRHEGRVEARRGEALARFAELSRAGKQALEKGDLGVALERLEEANGWAERAGREPHPLDALRERWRELRRVRCELRYAQAAAALARGRGKEALRSLRQAPKAPDPALARRLERLERLVVAGVPRGMVFVPGGPVPRGDVLQPDELPVELVFVEPFLIDRREVTRGEFAAFLEATGRTPPPGWEPPAGPEEAALPVAGVNWHEADAYARWAGKRLPSETEWEAAARSELPELESERDVVARERFCAAWKEGLAALSAAAAKRWRKLLAARSTTGGADVPPVFPAEAFAQDLPGAPRPEVEGERVRVSPRAAYALLAARRWPWGGFWDSRRVSSADAARPAGALGASPLGVEDLAGGVAEWTASAYRPYLGPPRNALEGRGHRVARGGSFRAAPEECRTAWRAAYAPGVRFETLGFRCARDLEAAAR